MEWSNVPTTNGRPVNEPFVTGRSECDGQQDWHDK